MSRIFKMSFRARTNEYVRPLDSWSHPRTEERSTPRGLRRAVADIGSPLDRRRSQDPSRPDDALDPAGGFRGRLPRGSRRARDLDRSAFYETQVLESSNGSSPRRIHRHAVRHRTHRLPGAAIQLALQSRRAH